MRVCLVEYARRLRNRIYQPQVKFLVPFDVIERSARALPALPDGYSVRSPLPGDAESWAALLNEDGKFGHWDADRVRREIVSRLIRPEAATLIHFGETLVGCCSTDATTLRGKRVGMGMYLYLAPRHRGRNLNHILIYRTLAHFLTGGYQAVMASTDPARHAALAVYLAQGYTPVHDSLLSPAQWGLIRWRLAPAVERLRRRLQTASRAGSQP